MQLSDVSTIVSFQLQSNFTLKEFTVASERKSLIKVLLWAHWHRDYICNRKPMPRAFCFSIFKHLYCQVEACFLSVSVRPPRIRAMRVAAPRLEWRRSSSARAATAIKKASSVLHDLIGDVRCFCRARPHDPRPNIMSPLVNRRFFSDDAKMMRRWCECQC